MKSYNAIFQEEHETKDATRIQPENLPDFELLCAGFPCQSFSIAGHRKGFEDTRGTLFFEIARITREKLPKILFLENVKGLLNHSNGQTFRKILETLDELGYNAQWQVLNSKYHGVPQNRERVFIVASRGGEPIPEVFPFREPDQRTSGESEKRRITHPCLTEAIGRGGSSSEFLKSLEKVNQADKEKDIKYINPKSSHQPKIVENPICINNQMRPESRPSIEDEGQSGGSGILFNEEGYSYTVSKSPHYVSHKPVEFNRNDGIGEELQIAHCLSSSDWRGLNRNQNQNAIVKEDSEQIRIRKLTPRECWRLQGFPDWAFEKAQKENSDTQLYKQAGNAVTVNVIEDIGKRLVKYYD